jgi:hypothetical protein
MIGKDNQPALRFALREYRIYINFRLLTNLNNPLFLEFLYEDKRKLLAVSGSMEKRKNSFKVPDRTYRDSDGGCYISRMALTEAFRSRMGWNRAGNYRVIGKYAEHLGLLLFDLKTASIVGKGHT